MNKIYLKLLFLLMAPILVFTGCEEDELVGEPSIVPSTTRASLSAIKLDEGRGSNIRGWAVAPVGLENVRITATRGGAEEELLNISDFNEENSEMNGTRYNYNVYPEYTPELTNITIAVTDISGRSTQLDYEVAASGGLQGPAFQSFPTGVIEANVRSNVNIRPEISGVVNSHWGLQSITIYETYGANEEEVSVITDFGGAAESYDFSYTPDYDRGLAQDLNAIRIVAVDKRGNESELEFSVSVIDAQPRPEISFDQEGPVEADLTVTPTVEPEVTGSIESFEDLASVSFYVVRSGVDEQFGEEITSFADPFNYSFTLQPPYALGVTAVKVEATDAAGQVSTAILPVQVKAVDEALTVYNGITLSAQGDRFTDNTLFNATDGTAHHYEEPVGNEEVARKMDFLLTDTNGDNNWVMFSPLGDAWLSNNFYKGVEWPYYNTTKLRLVEGGDETYFNQATSVTIQGLEMGEDFVLRLNGLQPGNVVFFETEHGIKGLMLFKSVLLDDAKNDDFLVDVKVVKP